MEDKDLIEKLKKLKETPIKREFLVSLQDNLKKYIEFYPIREEIRTKPFEKTSSFFGISMLKIVTITLIVMLISGGGEVVFASQKSLPGDILYSVKILTENLQETFTFNPQKKAELETRLAEKRIRELGDILEKQGVEIERLAVAEKRLVKYIANARQIIEKESAKGKDDKFTQKITDKLNNIEKEKKDYHNKVDLIIETEKETKEKADGAIKKEEDNGSSIIDNRGKKGELDGTTELINGNHNNGDEDGN